MNDEKLSKALSQAASLYSSQVVYVLPKHPDISQFIKQEKTMITAAELATKAEESIKVLGSDRCFDNWDEILPIDDLVKDMGNIEPKEVLTFLQEVTKQLESDEEAAYHLCHCIVHVMERDNEPLLDELYKLDHAFLSHLYG